MNDTTFRVVLRGYEPAQVNSRLEELTEAVAQATAQRDALAARLDAVERARAEEAAAPVQPSTVEPPTFEHLGTRVGQILTLASEEAEELRGSARADVSAERRRLEEDTTRMREEAERYAAETRSAAETEAARIVEDARRAADERLDTAEREAAARIQEAEVIHEEQRAKAVQSAADFENTLAARRRAAEEEFTRQMDEVERRLDEARQALEAAHLEAEQTEADARREATDLVRDAEEQAASIVDEARTRAVRVRADSDRELAAATQRRDAINAQLGNVRQMLATLTGSVTAPDPFERDEVPAPDDEQPSAADGPAGGPIEEPVEEQVEEHAGVEAH
jgi:cell division septum initiation protein DivIVA